MGKNAKERLLEFKDHLGITTNRLEKEIGVSKGYFSKLRHRPSDEVLPKILERYPELDRVWLLTGEGEMIRTANPAAGEVTSISKDVTAIATASSDDAVRVLTEQIATLCEQLREKDKQLREKDVQINHLFEMMKSNGK